MGIKQYDATLGFLTSLKTLDGMLRIRLKYLGSKQDILPPRIKQSRVNGEVETSNKVHLYKN